MTIICNHYNNPIEADNTCKRINEWIKEHTAKMSNLPVEELKQLLQKAMRTAKANAKKKSKSLIRISRTSSVGSVELKALNSAIELTNLSRSLQDGFSAGKGAFQCKTVDDEDEIISIDDDASKRLAHTKLIRSFLKIMKFPSSKYHLAENLLKKLLLFTKATQLCLLRATPEGKLLLDASLSPGRTWSLLKGLDITHSKVVLDGVLQHCSSTLKPVYTKSNQELYNYGVNDSCLKSVLCLPVVGQSRLNGCLFLSNTDTERAFDHLDFDVITLLASHLIASLNNFILKQSLLDNTLSVTKSVFGIQNIPEKLLQDTLDVYDEIEDSTKPMFVVLAKTKILCFDTPYDTHPKESIKIEAIKKIQLTSPKDFGNRIKKLHASRTSLKKIQNRQAFVSILTVYGRRLWLAFTENSAAKNWAGDIQNTLNRSSAKVIDINKNYRIAISDITRDRIIGKGAAGSVYKGTWNQTDVAIKELYDHFDASEQKSFFDELNILASLRHPNIVTLYGGYVNEKQRPCLVLELAEKGTLTSVLYDSDAVISNSRKYQIILQTAQALSYLHSLEPKIIHRDLKPDNILLSGDWTVKLADFGLARELAHTMTGIQGTVKWMAPEVLSNGPYSDKADIYSFSLIMWEVLMQKKFFEEFKFNSQLEVQVVNHDFRPPLPEEMSSAMKQLIQDCWSPDPDSRPPAPEIIKRLLKMSVDDCCVGSA